MADLETVAAGILEKQPVIGRGILRAGPGPADVAPARLADDLDQTIDPSLVNVTYTPGSGGNTETIGKVDGPDACENGGWYYDNPANPTAIELCETTCNDVQSDGAAKLNIVLGCATEELN